MFLSSILSEQKDSIHYHILSDACSVCLFYYRFSLNIVFDEGECSGSQPTIRVSTRLGRSVSVLSTMRNYTRWTPLSGTVRYV